jgi:hypothetical protein
MNGYAKNFNLSRFFWKKQYKMFNYKLFTQNFQDLYAGLFIYAIYYPKAH